MPMVTYENFVDLAALKLDHPGASDYTAATILGPDYPSTEDYRIYKWSATDESAPDDDEVVIPTTPNPATGITGGPGRWLKVDISTLPQVSSDWTATSGAAFILNKPSFATVATSGSYADLSNKPSIPSSQVNSDWTANSGVSQILNKPTIYGVTTVGGPTTRTLSLATAYQATDNTKPAVVTVNLNSTAALTLSGGTTIIGEVRIGSVNTVASGGSGTVVGSYKNSLTGSLVIGVAINTESQQTISFVLPAGWYFAVRQTTGTTLSIVSAFDQSISN